MLEGMEGEEEVPCEHLVPDGEVKNTVLELKMFETSLACVSSPFGDQNSVLLWFPKTTW